MGTSAGEGPGYFSRLHVVGIVTLAVLTAGLALFAWSIRPQSGGFPTVPSNLVFSFNGPQAGSFDESLTLTPGGGATLKLFDGGTGTPGPAWTLQIAGLGNGRLCTPSSYLYGADGGGAVAVTKVPQQTIGHPRAATVGGPLFSTEVQGSGLVFVRFCWSSGAPVAINGAYLNAQIPPVLSATSPVGYTVSRQLNLGSSDTSDFVLQSVIQPTGVTQGGWQWRPQRLSAGQALAVSAVDTSETQHDSYKAFLSGIVFGIAGGALVAIIQELVAPFRSRQESGPPEPGG